MVYVGIYLGYSPKGTQLFLLIFCLTCFCHFASWVFRYVGAGCASSSLSKEKDGETKVTPCVKARFVFFDSGEKLQKNGHVQPPQAQSSLLDVSYWEIWFDMVEVISFQYQKKRHKHKRSIIGRVGWQSSMQGLWPGPIFSWAMRQRCRDQFSTRKKTL